MTDDKTNDKGSWLIRYFRDHPAVGLTGTIVSLIGVVLTVYFFQAGREEPELTYFVHPAKAAVVRAQQDSLLEVRFDGQPLEGDITAAQIAFWNAGDKPIRGNDVLSPLVIRTGNKERILEATLRQTGREVAEITVDRSRIANGEVEIGWSILENEDGGVPEIIFMGDEEVEIQVDAVVVGQPSIVTRFVSSALFSPVLMGVFLSVTFLFFAFGALQLYSASRARRAKQHLWIAGALYIVFGLYLLINVLTIQPPFTPQW